MRKVHSRTSNNRARKLKNMENEKLTWYDMKYGEKHRKLCKMRNTHLEPGIWHETVKKLRNDKYTSRIWVMEKKLKNVQNETQKVYDLEYG